MGVGFVKLCVATRNGMGREDTTKRRQMVRLDKDVTHEPVPGMGEGQTSGHGERLREHVEKVFPIGRKVDKVVQNGSVVRQKRLRGGDHSGVATA